MSSLSGRRKESSVWNYFNYNINDDRSTCLCVSGDSGKVCGKELKGKNTTNLKTHLQATHAYEYKDYSEKEKAKREAKPIRVIKSTPVNKPNVASGFFGAKLWPENSSEYTRKITAISDAFLETGLPLRILDQPAVHRMFSALDPKLKPPGRTKIGNDMNRRYDDAVAAVKDSLQHSNRITVGMDIWSRANLESSYLAISVSLFNRQKVSSQQLLLNLHDLPHPHTGAHIAAKLELTLTEWNIAPHKILMVITDNGSNMVRAIKDLNHKQEGVVHTSKNDCGSISAVSGDDVEESDEESVDSQEYQLNEMQAHDSQDPDYQLIGDTNSESDEFDNIVYRRLGCLPHTLQLVVKGIYSITSVNALLAKARAVVRKLKKSSIAVSKIKGKTGKVLIIDNVTRWNSCYLMLLRLIDLKTEVTDVANEMGEDILLNTEWIRLELICTILKPFATHTRLLECDDIALGSIIPAIMDLQCHLEETIQQVSHQDIKEACQKMRSSLVTRFDYIQNPNCSNFEVIPVAATLLDPAWTKTICEENPELFCAGVSYIRECLKKETDVKATLTDDLDKGNTSNISKMTEPAAKKPRFEFLAKKLNSKNENRNINTSECELTRFINLATTEECGDSVLEFWLTNKNSFQILSNIALDLVSAPASQAYVERVFSHCGRFTAGVRNRMSTNLHRRVFMKMNNYLLT